MGTNLDILAIENFILYKEDQDKSLLKDESLQPIYFPSINKENYNLFVDEQSCLFM